MIEVGGFASMIHEHIMESYIYIYGCNDKTFIQGSICECKVFPKLAKIKLSHILDFGNVLPCGRGVGHARGLPGARTRAAVLDYSFKN